MKRVCLLAVAVAMVFTVSVSTAAAEMYNGPYIGVNLGYGVASHNLESVPAGLMAIDSASAGGVSAGLFGGYGATSDQGVYFGVEVEGSWSSGEYDMNVGGSILEITQDWTVGVSARLGGMITRDVLGYVRAGWVATRFEVQEKVPTPWSQKDTYSGPRIGVGLEVALDRNVSLRADYTYTWYDSKDLVNAGVVFMSSKPSEQLFRVGLAYNF